MGGAYSVDVAFTRMKTKKTRTGVESFLFFVLFRLQIKISIRLKFVAIFCQILFKTKKRFSPETRRYSSSILRQFASWGELRKGAHV